MFVLKITRTYSRKQTKPFSLSGDEFLPPFREEVAHRSPMVDTISMSSDSDTQPPRKPRRRALVTKPKTPRVPANGDGRKRRLPVNELTMMHTADQLATAPTSPQSSDQDDEDLISDGQTERSTAKCRRSVQHRGCQDNGRFISVAALRKVFKRAAPTRYVKIRRPHRSMRHESFKGNDGFELPEMILLPNIKIRKKHRPKQPLSMPRLELRKGLLPDVHFHKQRSAFPLAPQSPSVEPKVPVLQQERPKHARNRPLRKTTREMLASITAPARAQVSEGSGDKSQDDGTEIEIEFENNARLGSQEAGAEESGEEDDQSVSNTSEEDADSDSELLEHDGDMDVEDDMDGIGDTHRRKTVTAIPICEMGKEMRKMKNGVFFTEYLEAKRVLSPDLLGSLESS